MGNLPDSEPADTNEGHYMDAIVLNRITELWRYRQWWRTNRWADWPQVRHDLELELRALVKLARAARRVEATRPDPMDQFKSYHEWQAAGPA